MSEDPEGRKAVNDQPHAVSTRRRAFLTGGLVATTAAAGGFIWGRSAPGADRDAASQTVEGGEALPAGPADAAQPVTPYGVHQAGIAAPDPRQALTAILVFGIDDPRASADLLDRLGSAAGEFQDPDSFNGLGPHDITLTVGIGTGVVREHFGESAPGATELPSFAREDIEASRQGGDLVVQLCCTEPAVLSLAETRIRSVLKNDAELRWRSEGFRGYPDMGVGRNLLGFHDGVSIPRSKSEFTHDVWLSSPAPLAGGSIMVVRKMRMDVATFTAQPLAEQEKAIGRERKSGVPLSGGKFEDDPDLHAKSEAGAFAIPNNAHVRRAHPLPAGVRGLMLRRSYSYSNGPDDQGLLFVSYQNELDTFVRTQKRMDEGDALLDHTVTTASGTFLILPGFDEGRGLGDRLRT